MLKAKIFKGNYEPIEEFPEGWGFKPKKPSVSKAKIFKGNYQPKQEFPEGWGVQTRKNPLWGEYGYFLEQDYKFNLHTLVSDCKTVSRQTLNISNP